MKVAEWSGWNERGRYPMCPVCEGPKNYVTHEVGCQMDSTLAEIEALHPWVTQPIPLDPIEEIEAQRLLGTIIDQMKKPPPDGDVPGLRPFWKF